ncbi:MAG TPA: saccharopine dehydrogenase C-terminal domain-containing protein [Candidatus Kapabacteria bacterium]|nr:saccharopine dehydrogenase C-terminal domain-containing protein [Candidatus Kapabacteria bacterium]
MKKVAVLGAGMVGSAIARDLANNFDVTSFDMNEGKLNSLSNYGIKTHYTDLSSPENISSAIQGSDFVVNATPGFMGYTTLREIIKNKKDVVDIAFFPENSLELNSLAEENGVTAIVDIGVAPGMSNFLLGYHSRLMKVNDFICYVGGLPVIRELPFQYKAPFSPIDVIEEYTRIARFVENGKIVSKAAMSDREYISFEGIGTLEAFNSDGLRTLIDTIDVPNMIEKTLRYPGHIEMIINLRDMGFFENSEIIVKDQHVNILDFTSKVLINKWKLNDNDTEFTVMKIIIRGVENDKMLEYTYNLLDRTDTQNNISSMARTTGYTATAALNMINEGLFNKKGVFPPENIALNYDIYQYILSYLKLRGIDYRLEVKY